MVTKRELKAWERMDADPNYDPDEIVDAAAYDEYADMAYGSKEPEPVEVGEAKRRLEDAVTNLSLDGQARYRGSDWRTRNEAWSAIQTGDDPDTVARALFED